MIVNMITYNIARISAKLFQTGIQKWVFTDFAKNTTWEDEAKEMQVRTCN